MTPWAVTATTAKRTLPAERCRSRHWPSPGDQTEFCRNESVSPDSADDGDATSLPDSWVGSPLGLPGPRSPSSVGSLMG